MLSLQEFYAKRVLQIYAVIARILSTPYTAIILWGFSSNNATTFEQRAVGSATMIFPAQLHHLLIS